MKVHMTTTLSMPVCRRQRQEQASPDLGHSNLFDLLGRTSSQLVLSNQIPAFGQRASLHGCSVYVVTS